FESTEEIVNPNCVKVVTTESDQALYFSRAMIPFNRDAGITSVNAKEASYLKHIGIYSFYAGSLKAYVSNGECTLEKLEKLEQLRWLWMGRKIKVLRDDFSGSTGIDTQEDLKRVESYLTNLKNN
ncbi:MAG: 3-deoxy-manno-octulosonate cytidylyltransferase, partial [Burkholderiaceae bacterium]